MQDNCSYRYMQFFPIPKNSSGKYLFEKSATYFEGEVVPKRVKSLLPSAKLVRISLFMIICIYIYFFLKFSSIFRSRDSNVN